MAKSNGIWGINEIKRLCLGAVRVSSQTLRQQGSQGKEEVFDEKVVDISTYADRAVSDALLAYFREKRFPAIAYSEESGRVRLSTAVEPDYLVCFDDIDGTENWKRGDGMMPYATIVFVYDRLRPRFKDALAAVLYEHTAGHTWYAIRGGGCHFKRKGEKRFQKCSPSDKKTLDKKTGIRVDLYSMTNHMDVVAALADAAWVKDTGSSGHHLASVSSGTCDAFVNSAGKGHEFGAGYLLITEAGGSVVDWKGNSYADKPFDFDVKYDYICASTNALKDEILCVMGRKI